MTDPEPQQEPLEPVGLARTFAVGDERWVARVAGAGLGGTGNLSSARFVIIRFCREGEDAARCEALLPAGHFEHLYDSELARLLATARPGGS